MKKWSIAILSIIMIVVLSACGGSSSKTSASSSSSSSSSTASNSSSSNSSSSSSTNASSGNSKKGTLVFADAGWDSIRVHNDIARFILENGYGYKTDVISGSTPATFTGLEKGNINVYMEVWINNIQKIYDQAIKAGKIKNVGVNYSDDMQGFYVPTYVIKGDPKRGIKPVAPDLKTVQDLKKYAKVFKDPADPNKGRIIGAPTGWAVDQILQTKMKTYGLDKTFNYFNPGSSAALSSSLTKAYKSGKPWVGYYWTPTWIMGKYNMTLLQEPKYNKATWDKNKGTAFPANKVVIAVDSKTAKDHPEVVKFLSHYHTSSALTNEALAYMQANNAKPMDAAKWWLKKHEDLWTKWVPSDVASKVKSALQ